MSSVIAAYRKNRRGPTLRKRTDAQKVKAMVTKQFKKERRKNRTYGKTATKTQRRLQKATQKLRG